MYCVQEKKWRDILVWSLALHLPSVDILFAMFSGQAHTLIQISKVHKGLQRYNFRIDLRPFQTPTHTHLRRLRSLSCWTKKHEPFSRDDSIARKMFSTVTTTTMSQQQNCPLLFYQIGHLSYIFIQCAPQIYIFDPCVCCFSFFSIHTGIVNYLNQFIQFVRVPFCFHCHTHAQQKRRERRYCSTLASHTYHFSCVFASSL